MFIFSHKLLLVLTFCSSNSAGSVSPQHEQEQLIYLRPARYSSSLGSAAFNVYGGRAVCGVTVMIHDVMGALCTS